MEATTYAGHDFRFNVAHDGLPFLAFGRRLAGDEVAQVARLDAGSDAPLAHRLHVLGDVVDHLASALAKLFAVHICWREAEISALTTIDYLF